MNLEPIRALLESAKAAAVKPTFGDHPDALAYAEMRTTEFAKAAIPALSQLLEAVDNDHAKAALAAYDEYKHRIFRGEHSVSISGAYAEFQKQACLSVLLLHPEDK